MYRIIQSINWRLTLASCFIEIIKKKKSDMIQLYQRLIRKSGDNIFVKVTVKLLTRFVSPLLHVPDTYIDVSSMSAMPQSCNTDQNYTFLEA